MDSQYRTTRSRPWLEKESDETALLETLRCVEQRYFERFGTMNAVAQYETPLTPEQEARVESLMDVPMHWLDLDDSTDRVTLQAHRAMAELGDDPILQARAAAHQHGPWGFWSDFCGSGVNTLTPSTKRSPVSTTSLDAPPAP